MRRFLHPEDVATWSRSFQSIQKSKHQRLWCRLLSTSGEIHWCEIRMQMMHNNPLSYISATLCDITSQVRSDNIRQADHRSLTAMVNRLPVILYRARNNRNWSMEYVSDGCLTLTGYPAEQLVNHTQLSFASLIHPDDSAAVWEKVQTALQKQSVFDLRYRLIHANGNVLHVSEKGQGIYADTGAILGVEGIIFQQENALEKENSHN
jgi:PAS domain S-box-containing protein